jgi:hypothetical protein
MGKSSGNALQRAHTIRVSAVRIPQTERWTVRSYVSWKFTSGEETLVHADLEFGSVKEAMQGGVEFAIKWIDEAGRIFIQRDNALFHTLSGSDTERRKFKLLRERRKPRAIMRSKIAIHFACR